MADKVQPIKPSEVVKLKLEAIPDAVIEAFNEMIAKNMIGKHAKVLQHEVMVLIKKKGLKESAVYDNNWLEIEDLYRAAGWKVKYTSPVYDENFDAYFDFSK